MTEILYHRANTEAFILADPVAITLKFREKIDLPSGGFKWGPETAREEQSFKMIPQTDVMPTVTTPDGVTLLPGYVILGRYDAVMERWDNLSPTDCVTSRSLRSAPRVSWGRR